jgi:hypothetical protein
MAAGSAGGITMVTISRTLTMILKALAWKQKNSMSDLLKTYQISSSWCHSFL